MRPWHAHTYRTEAATAGINPTLVDSAVAEIQTFLATTPEAAPVLSLAHLAHEAGVPHNFLRSIIRRSHSRDHAYVDFVIIGRSGKRRPISTPTRSLMTLQRWVAENVLSRLPVGPNAYAYAKHRSVVDCAREHCNSRWLMKIDVRSFFASIDERCVYRIFRRIGYRELVAFELARLCTWPVKLSEEVDVTLQARKTGPDYHYASLGSLPIGAPTSPMLSNLYMDPFDRSLSIYCAATSLVYTRYADDIFISSQDAGFTRSAGIEVVRSVRARLAEIDLRVNEAKTAIVPPGARKIVLGLLVNGNEPRLPPEFKKRMRMHYHFLERLGTRAHADARHFPSVPMLERHLRGLIAYAAQVDFKYAKSLAERHNRLNWTYLD